MQITTTQVDRKAIVKIEGKPGIASVADAKPVLVAAMVDSDEIHVDLGEVGQCDTAGIQLLLMARAGARAKGIGFATSGHTDAVRAALDRAAIPAEMLECRTDARDGGQDNRTGE